MSNVSPIDSILKKCDPKLQAYVRQFQSDVVKLAKHNARLQTENITLKSRVKSLEAEVKKPMYSGIDTDELPKRAVESLKKLKGL
jgi:cell division protein FtsB